MKTYSRYTLENGVRVLIERMPESRIVAVGLWVDVGSRDESPHQGGITHFIEHMLFKGTRKRDVFALARDLNALGGNFNAFTTPEQLCLHTTVIENDVGPALTILAEMLLESVFPEQEVENERGVILGEIAEQEDVPEDYVEEKFFRVLWPGNALGRPVTGHRETVERLTREQLVSFWSSHFTPNRLIVTLAGGVDRRRVMPVVRRLFDDLERRKNGAGRRVRPRTNAGITAATRHLEQIHFCLGVEGPPKNTPDRFALSVFNALYGGGLGSRLSNEIREKRGLAYSIWSNFAAFNDVGSFAIRGSTAPENLEKVVELSLKELRKMFRRAPSEREVRTAREQCVRGFLLGLESAGARMNRLGENEMGGLEISPASEVVRRLEAVTPRSLQEVIKRYFEGKSAATALVGRVNGHRRHLQSLTL